MMMLQVKNKTEGSEEHLQSSAFMPKFLVRKKKNQVKDEKTLKKFSISLPYNDSLRKYLRSDLLCVSVK